MPPKISVALITKRTGGMDIAKHSLACQTFKDFELILVDELYRKRHDAVEKYFRGSGIDLVHVDASKENHPKWRPWDFTVIRSYNLALAHARGEIMVKIDDTWVLSPTALEATWRAWKIWGKRGLNTLLVPAAKHFLQVKPIFQRYISERGAVWSGRGGSDHLDAPPDTYISIFTQDFSENTRIEMTAEDDRCPSFRVDKTMRDPSPNDPPEWRRLDAGVIGGFRYWVKGGHSAWALVAPVEDAIKVNGWDYSYCGKWGGEEEINQRMEQAFKHRYVCTVAAMAYQLPHMFEPVSWVSVKSNLGFPECNKEKTAQRIREKHCWADNPFNLEEECQRIREGKKTVIFDY